MFKLSWLSSLTLAWILCLPYSAPAGQADGRFDIYWIDTEGGAATLVVTPSGESLLFDTGNPGLRDPNRIVKVATQQAEIKKIDHLVTTHYHTDHYGGAAMLSQLMPIGTVYDNGTFEGMPNDPGKEYFEFACDARKVMNPGDVIPLRSNASTPAIEVRCVGTRKSFVEPAENAVANAEVCAACVEKDRDGSDNANSIVCLISFGDFRFFDGGDLTWNQEAKLVCPVDLIGPVDVYQVTHHGLDSSNNPIVLKTIQPRVAVMNNGDRKGCLPEVFATLKETPSIERVFQMHKNLRPDGVVNNVEDRCIANHLGANECKGHPIKLSVSPDSLSYRISIDSTGLTEEFKTRAK